MGLTTRIITWEETDYSIPIIRKGIVLSDLEKIEASALVCKMYATDRFTLDDCCQYIGLTSRTFFNWRSNVSAISDAFKVAQEKKDKLYFFRLKEKARTMAEKLIEGYKVVVVEKEMEASRKENGEIEMIVLTAKEKEMYIKPNVKLIETVLLNLDKSNFQRNPTSEKESEEVNIPPIKWVD